MKTLSTGALLTALAFGLAIVAAIGVRTRDHYWPYISDALARYRALRYTLAIGAGLYALEALERPLSADTFLRFAGASALVLTALVKLRVISGGTP